MQQTGISITLTPSGRQFCQRFGIHHQHTTTYQEKRRHCPRKVHESAYKGMNGACYQLHIDIYNILTLFARIFTSSPHRRLAAMFLLLQHRSRAPRAGSARTVSPASAPGHVPWFHHPVSRQIFSSTPIPSMPISMRSPSCR
jgi:hypothetical protein